MKEALLYECLEGGAVRCHVCQRRCRILPGEVGYCTTRVNESGTLYSLIYGEVSTCRVAPSEIKPLFHFYPGSRFLSLGSLGCNFRCINCQNWEIAHVRLCGSGKVRGTQKISPRRAVELAETLGCQGISWTYNEPTLWLEYTVDTAILAKKRGMATNYVTNGFITEEGLDLIAPSLDAFRVDIKGFSREFYRKVANVEGFEGILTVTARAKNRWGIHVEVVTNVVPGLNDSESELSGIAHWIRNELGHETPWHVTRFVPHLELNHLPYTPVEILERARNVGIEAGLTYVYLGNVPGHSYENTWCPSCGHIIIRRDRYRLVSYDIVDGHCRYCGRKIPIVAHTP